MKLFSVALLITGIFLMSLSGIERIVIYASINERVGDYQSLKAITPHEIWNITKVTFISGVLLSVVGLIMSLWKFITKMIEMIKESSREFEIEHGLNKENKDRQ